MREALGKLTGGLDDITVVKNDASSIRCKARWQDALFTLTLTCNTGYVTVQGPSALVLAFGSHVAGLIGGTVYVAKDTGHPPHNPKEETPEVERPTPIAVPTATDGDEETQRGRPLAADPGGSVVSSASEGGSSNVMMNNTIISINETETSADAMGGLAGMLRSLLRISPPRSEG